MLKVSRRNIGSFVTCEPLFLADKQVSMLYKEVFVISRYDCRGEQIGVDSCVWVDDHKLSCRVDYINTNCRHWQSINSND